MDAPLNSNRTVSYSLGDTLFKAIGYYLNIHIITILLVRMSSSENWQVKGAHIGAQLTLTWAIL
jgi:hypothetical protein